jgi:hypothetical protein
MLIPRPGVTPEAPASQEMSAYEAAATLACRTPVGTDTHAADGKAAIVLSLLGIMFTVLARFGPELGYILRHGITKTGIIRVLCAIMLLGFSSFSLCAVVQAFRTIVPRFRRDKPSLAFFAEIASMEREAYFAKVETMTMQDAVAQILLYNHTAATICAEKYKQLARTLKLFEAAAACWLVLVLVLVFKSLHG